MASTLKWLAIAVNALALVDISLSSVISSPRSASCRCLPGDSCWPSTKDWNQLNKTVGGRLIATVPVGSVCHDPTYNAAACSSLQKQWEFPRTHFASPSSIMSPIFLNQTCDAFTPESQPCLIGNYVDYSINVNSAADAAAGVKFAQDKNIRLVIKNTGHDYLGKSTGKGALGLWTHNLKSLTVVDYNSKAYSGKAVKMGAGVQAFEAYEFADSHGLRVLGGECPTVGIAGGYTQGGGHSTLSSNYGLAADNTLEWEVVTADGRHLVATPTQNSDLYWALSGGGGGTYAVVISLTTRAHPDGKVGGASLSFNTTEMSQDTFWDMIGTWHAGLPALVDTGAEAYYIIYRGSFVFDFTSPGSTKDQVVKLLKPFTDELDSRKLKYTFSVTSYPNFYQHFNNYFGPLPDGPQPVTQITGGRMVPRSVVQDKTKNAALTSAMRSMTADGTFAFGNFALNVAHKVAGNTPSSNAVLPAWRDAIFTAVVAAQWNFTVPFSDMLKAQDRLTNEIIPQIEKVTPGSGTYLNEGDYQLATWKEDFFGANYDRLRQIKKKYDPKDFFYATKAVGSDAWAVADDGRLCRA